jgi:hypothetical protein
MDDASPAASGPDQLTDAMRSARGWNGVQLAALAFVGLCGVLTGGRPDLPRWLQVTAGLLALGALALATCAVFLVATVAWPLRTRPEPSPDDALSGARGRRLRVGIALTYVAVAVMALAASANWWPVTTAGATDESGAAAVFHAVDGAGNDWCGTLTGSRDGAIVLSTGRGGVELALARLVRLDPVDAC